MKKPDSNALVLRAFCPSCRAAVPVTGRNTHALHTRPGRQSLVSYRYQPRRRKCEGSASPVAAGEVDCWLASEVTGALGEAARYDRAEDEARKAAALALATAEGASAAATGARARAETYRAELLRRQAAS